ncbi:MAG TPA: helix-turn-helix domain-containing protein [Longimicrobiales bacterium]
MSSEELLSALAYLPDDAVLTVSVRKKDLLAALEARAGGPRVFSTAQAAEFLGYTVQRWRRWAQAGVIAGAWQDEGGRWRLPRAACEAHLERLQREGRSPERRARRAAKRRAALTGQLEIEAAI